MKHGFLDKLIQRLDRVEPGEVQAYLSRLVQEKGFFESVFEALQEGLIVADPEGELTYLNRAAGELFGLRESAVGSKISAAIRGLDWEALTASGRVVSRDLEVFYPENRYLNFYIAPVELPKGDASAAGVAGKPLGWVMIVRDITQTRRMTEEMIESERITALTMLAAGVAHEIGNPLNSLNIHLQLLERKLRKVAPDAMDSAGEMLEVARSEVKRLDFIVKQFLSAIRPTQPQMKRLNLNDLIRESLRFLEPELEDRGILVQLELHSKIPLLNLDGDQMKQAFYNLIKNAAQAMGNGGQLAIRSNLTDYEVVATFADTGKGMEPEVISNLFQPYFTTKKSGTGLGLLIVRRIVREHGGEIEIESEPGSGTAISVHLPRGPKAVRFLEATRDEDAAAAGPIPTDPQR